MPVIMGIDPGSHFTGYGVIEYQERKIFHRAHGVVAVPKALDFSRKLNFLNEQLHSLFRLYHPQETVVEKIFFGKNAETAFKLGHVRGICLQKTAEWKAKFFEYASCVVKKSITGKGNSSKTEVRWIVFHTFHLESQAREDASDALALALCHARNRETLHWLKAKV